MEEWEHWLEITSHPVNQKKCIRVRSTKLKKWVEYGPISGRCCLLDELASRWEACICIYIHVHVQYVHNKGLTLHFLSIANGFPKVSKSKLKNSTNLTCAIVRLSLAWSSSSLLRHPSPSLDRGDDKTVYWLKIGQNIFMSFILIIFYPLILLVK